VLLAFDASGNLFVANANNTLNGGTVKEFAPPFSSSSSPITTITNSLASPDGVALIAGQ
jgi:hypothetical protein